MDDTHTGAPTSAVWHHGSSTLYFVSGPMNTWSPPDSYHSLMGDGVDPQESVTCTVNGTPMTEHVPVTNSAFTLTDEDHTTYQFGGTGHIYWQVNGCMALPHYLLASITDRWQRKLTITWGTPSGTTEPRVMSVTDSTGNGLAFGYSGDLIQTIQDPQNRTHRLTCNPVPAEDGHSYSKLTGVQVMGPGDSTRTTYNWSFAYQDPNDPQNLAYGGTYTGDLVIHKTDPAQVTENFFYEPISMAGGSTPRLREEDWDGRLAKITWTDTDGSAREIDRSPFDSTNSQDTLTFFPALGDPYLPNGIPVQYTFDAYNNTTMVRDTLTNRLWQYGYDTAGGDQSRVHNLKTVNTPLEPTQGMPLVQYDYIYTGADQIGQITESVRQDAAHGGGLGDPVDIHLNSLHLPYQITARSRDGLHDQTTLFWYDGFMDGTSGTVGDLTTLIEASGQTEAQTTTFTYLGAAGAWGLPDSMTNPVGGTSNYGYDSTGVHPSGRLLTAASPENLLYPMGDASHNASVTTLMYNQDGLPSLVQDPMGHQISIGYNAPSAGSGNLVIKITRIATPALPARQITLDPRGRVILDQDEMGVQTVQTWNAEDQLLSVTRAAGTADAATTTLHYNAQDDLDYFDPPSGSSSRVKFEYGRYLLLNPGQSNEMIAPDGTYEGQVTRIVYPPTPTDMMQGTSEYLIYNDAGELAYRKKADGSHAIAIGRDVLHRITSLTYPASAVDTTSFTTTVQYDEFGRPSTTTDRRGTTTLVWDNLNRISKVMPPAPQHEVDYNYFHDNGPVPMDPTLTYHRWRTQVSLPDLVTAGIIPSFYEYQEDNKGALAAVVSPFNQTTTLHTDLDGKNVEVDLPNGTRELRGYLEPEDWLSSIQILKQNGMTLDQLAYSYVNSMGQLDATGHLQSETYMGNQVHAFAYNHRYELLQEMSPDLGLVSYGYADKNGNRTSRTVGTMTDYYGLDANNKLMWVNRGVNGPPTSGQMSPYMLFSYDLNGNTIHRERRFDDGVLQSFDLYSDGADNLRSIWQHGGSQVYAAAYNGDNLLVSMQDTAGGSFPTQHEYTWGLGGLLYDLYQNAVYTPGVSQNLAGTDSFFHSDWLGSTRYLTDSTGNGTTAALRYAAFGARTDTNPTFTRSFSSRAAGGIRVRLPVGRRRGRGHNTCSSGIMIPGLAASPRRIRSHSWAG